MAHSESWLGSLDYLQTEYGALREVYFLLENNKQTTLVDKPNILSINESIIAENNVKWYDELSANQLFMDCLYCVTVSETNRRAARA